jgi:hypothetical protein
MRTTVEMKPEHRSALLAIAARRGQKGFSQVLEEIIDKGLADESEQEKRIQTALSLSGTISEEEAEAWQEAAQKVRESWR